MIHPPYIYAETAFHHEGDYDYLVELINEAHKSGLQGVKFQVLINPNELLSSFHSNYETLSQYIFPFKQWVEIFKITRDLGLDIIFMPLDSEAFNLPIEQIAYFDLHPISFYDNVIIEKMKEHGTPIILGVGGRTQKEIADLVKILGKQVEVLMTGFQSFPTDINDVKLSRIQSYAQQFPDLAIGYADHSSYNDQMSVTSNDYAFILGASVFEKHLTLNEGEKRVDFEAAIGAEKMLQIKNNLDRLHSLLSIEQIWEMSGSERKYTERQRVAVAKNNISKGAKISSEDISYKMIDKTGGFNPSEDIIGKKVTLDILKDDIILKSCIG